MSEQQVAELLARDLSSNFAWVQLGFAATGCVLLVFAAVLAARAHALLSEARLTMYKQRRQRRARYSRQSTPQNINAASQRKPVRVRPKTLP